VYILTRNILELCGGNAKKIKKFLQSGFKVGDKNASIPKAELINMESWVKTGRLVPSDFEKIYESLNNNGSLRLDILESHIQREVHIISQRASSIVTNYFRDEQGLDSLKEAFIELDADGDGTLSLEEFVQGVKEMGLKMNSKDAKVVFALIDDDGSGSVTLDELIEWQAQQIKRRLEIHQTLDKIIACVGNREGLGEIVEVFKEFDTDGQFLLLCCIFLSKSESCFVLQVLEIFHRRNSRKPMQLEVWY
jgi:Ca2+-binding EF-hand superfamily protein